MGRPTTRYFAAVPAGHVVCEEHAARERCREPVRETEVRVGLRQGRGDALDASRHDHGAGYIAATAEDDVGRAAAEDAQAGEGSAHCTPDRAREVEPELAGEARDGERVELEAGLRNQTRLDAVWRPGERHRYSAFAERFRDGESRPNVACGPAGRDQAHELGRLAHSRRC